MSKIALLELTVPDDVKEDDVFNYMRRTGQLKMNLVSLKLNPNDPPTIVNERLIKVVFEARGAEDASKVEDDIHSALITIPKVKGCEIRDVKHKF